MQMMKPRERGRANLTTGYHGTSARSHEKRRATRSTRGAAREADDALKANPAED